MPRPGILHLFARCTPLRFAFTGIKLPENFNQTLIETYSLHVPSARQGQCHLHTCKISLASLYMSAHKQKIKTTKEARKHSLSVTASSCLSLQAVRAWHNGYRVNARIRAWG